MTDEEIDKEFEEWFSPGKYDDRFLQVKEAYLAGRRKGLGEINEILNFIPEGWQMPLGFDTLVAQIKEAK